jgi:hypothetical protein
LTDETSLVYLPRPIKRARRGKDDISELREALYGLIEQAQPVTVRQVFYLAVSAGLVEKTENAYKHTVGRLLTDMRRNEELPYEWIADNTRWMRKPRSHNSLEACLQATAQLYRRNIWSQQPVYVEIWLEKDALAGVLYQVTEQWDVPLMVTRGYASLSYLYGAAAHIRSQQKPTSIYYFGDHDPSGRDIPRKVEEELRALAPRMDILFTRVAVEPYQIALWRLPTRPTKATDSRSKSFEGESVEVDAIPPDTLRRLVEECIVPNVDERALNACLVAEDNEREILKLLTPENIAQFGNHHGLDNAEG